MAFPAVTTAALLSAPLLVLLVVFGHMATSSPTESCLEDCICYNGLQKLKTINCTSFKPVLAAASSLLSDFSHIDVLNVEDVTDGSSEYFIDGLFTVFSKVKYMKLTNASISKIYPNAFKGLKHLEELDLSNNKIFRFSPETFSETMKLKTLDLSNNPLRLFPNTFLMSKSVEDLILSSCNLTSIPAGSFKGLPNLKYLDLYDNHIQSFTLRSFPRGLKHLWMAKNNLTNILTKALTALNKLTKVDISENPINCTCSLIGLQDSFSSKGIIFENGVNCEYPVNYNGKSWVQVSEEDVCDVKESALLSSDSDESSDDNSCENDICDNATSLPAEDPAGRYFNYNHVQGDQPFDGVTETNTPTENVETVTSEMNENLEESSGDNDLDQFSDSTPVTIANTVPRNEDDRTTEAPIENIKQLESVENETDNNELESKDLLVTEQISTESPTEGTPSTISPINIDHSTTIGVQLGSDLVTSTENVVYVSVTVPPLTEIVPVTELSTTENTPLSTTSTSDSLNNIESVRAVESESTTPEVSTTTRDQDTTTPLSTPASIETPEKEEKSSVIPISLISPETTTESIPSTEAPIVLTTVPQVNNIPKSVDESNEVEEIITPVRKTILESGILTTTTPESGNETGGVMLPSTNSREGKMLPTSENSTHESIGPYIVLAGIILILLLLILYASTKSSNKGKKKGQISDTELNMTELQDMKSLLPNSPTTNGHKNEKYPNEEPSATAKLLESDDQHDSNGNNNYNPNSNGNGFIYPEEPQVTHFQGDTGEKKNEPNKKSTLPRTNGTSDTLPKINVTSAPPPVELTTAKVRLLHDSLPRTPIYIQKSSNS